MEDLRVVATNREAGQMLYHSKCPQISVLPITVAQAVVQLVEALRHETGGYEFRSQ